MDDYQMEEQAETLFQYTLKNYRRVMDEPLTGTGLEKLALKVSLAVAANRLNQELFEKDQEENQDDYILFQN